ncbi:hypothetical protein [Flavobacterium sp. LB2P53]|uniref:hypothetical protein n=1 Tax=Flavobacterium sp. LB2P53 TaxID=2497481 RepID=UPI000F833DEF|nr:hypothetical protein [Flavobacterium sp. LB2P53]RTY69678.1 hypothetical protein EKL95_05815 [Flavobacterium sp. LB2P53]
MIDNIRFNFKFKPDENWLSNQKINLSLREEWSSGKGKGFTGKLFLNNSAKKLENGKSKPYLLIQIKLLENDELRIVISNSLRKWFFDKEVIGDFNKTEFEKCLNIISEKLEVPEDILLGAKVTRAEYGANLGMREKYRCFFACIHSHDDLKKKCIYGNETIEFKGENRSVIFYDKITEQKGKTFSAKNEKKINNVKLLLRYEIKVKKMSGAPEKPLMEYLSKIIENWDSILDSWVIELEKITFVKSMNSKVYDYLKNAKIKPITQYLVYLGMESLGLEKWRLILSDRMYSKTRKTAMKAQTDIYNDFKSKIGEEDFEVIFKGTVKNRADYLKA